METIKGPEHALALLKRAVDERGADHVANLYDMDSGEVIERGSDDSTELSTGCRYFTPGTGAPDCIVGHVLHYLGVDHFVAEGNGAGTVVRDHGLADETLSLGEINHIARILDAAQMAQDEGNPWGEALAAAQREYKRQPVG